MRNLDKEIREISEWISTDFERNLLLNSLHKLRDINDPTRYTSFAGIFREFFRHFLSKLAPDDDVRSCEWFVISDESKPKMITRAQRVQYIICKGLIEEFVEVDLGFDLRGAKSQTLKPIDVLNKLVHLDEDTYNIDASVGDDIVDRCVTALHMFITNVNRFNHELISSYERKLYDKLFELFMEETFDDLDVLSTHTRFEGVSLDKVSILDIDSNEIQIEVSGYVDVELQYGSDRDNRDDDCTYTVSYPFDAINKIIPVISPFSVDIEYEDIHVDTSSFYDDESDFDEIDYFDFEDEEYEY